MARSLRSVVDEIRARQRRPAATLAGHQVDRSQVHVRVHTWRPPGRPPHLDFLEVFSGTAVLTKAVREAGLKAQNFDICNAAEEDIVTPDGFWKACAAWCSGALARRLLDA